MVCGEVEGMDTAGRGGRPRILGTWRAADDVSMHEKRTAMKKTKMM